MMDDYNTLFSGSPEKDERARLFEGYLKQTAEGQARAAAITQGSSSSLAEQVWKTLTVQEQTTFLAVTAALGVLHTPSGATLLTWIDRLEEIHGGDRKYPNGPRFRDDQAFRLYARLATSALTELRNDQLQFRNTCTQRAVGYRGSGINHMDFCTKFQRPFQINRKTRDLPNVQFNVTSPSCCADIDIDYDRVLHMTRPNSDVLARNHTKNRFIPAYCDPGFDY